jgi:hypothetical protein
MGIHCQGDVGICMCPRRSETTCGPQNTCAPVKSTGPITWDSCLDARVRIQTFALLSDAGRRSSRAVLFPLLILRSRSALAAENLVLRKQLGLFQERKIRSRRAHDSTRWLMAALGRFFNWRDALVVVPPETLIRWHRKGFRLFWRGNRNRPGARRFLPTSAH